MNINPVNIRDIKPGDLVRIDGQNVIVTANEPDEDEHTFTLAFIVDPSPETK